MFITLTNTADGHLGDKIRVNMNHITTIYDFAEVEGGSRRTCLYASNGNVTYNVEESVETIIKMINDAKKS